MVRNDIPKDKPVLLVLTDGESVDYIKHVLNQDNVCYTHGDTLAAIEHCRNMKYNCVVFTTDITSATRELLDTYVIGALRSGWRGYSIDSFYMWEDESGQTVTSDGSWFSSYTDPCDAILSGEVFE